MSGGEVGDTGWRVPSLPPRARYTPAAGRWDAVDIFASNSSTMNGSTHVTSGKPHDNLFPFGLSASAFNARQQRTSAPHCSPARELNFSLPSSGQKTQRRAPTCRWPACARREVGPTARTSAGPPPTTDASHSCTSPTPAPPETFPDTARRMGTTR